MDDIPVLKTIDDVIALPWEEFNFSDKTSGVYMLVDPESTQPCQYVGKGASVKVRLRGHHVYDPDKHKVFVLPIERENNMLMLEAQIIRIMRPPRNGNGGIVPKEYMVPYLRGLLTNKRVKPSQLQMFLTEVGEDKTPDPIMSKGVGLRRSEWEALKEIADELGMTVNGISALVIRDFIRRYKDGDIPTTERKTLK